MEEFDKKYYKIKDVAEILSVPASTLRYWESEFPEISPRRYNHIGITTEVRYKIRN